MGFGHRSVFVRAIERPVHGVGGDAVKIAFFTEIAVVFNEEPDLAVHDVIDLFRLMLMRFGMISRAARGDHQAALVAVTLAHDHLASAGFTALITLVFLHLASFDM